MKLSQATFLDELSLTNVSRGVSAAMSEFVEAINPAHQNGLRSLVARGRMWFSERAASTSPALLRGERAILQLRINHAEAMFLILLGVCSFVLRIWGVSHLHVWDENVYLLNADLIRTGVAPYDEISSRPPLLSLFFAGAMAVWHSDYAAWVVAVALNALGPVFLYLAGKRFVGQLPALTSSVMMSFAPYLANAFNAQSPNFAGDNTGHSLMTDCPALTMILLSFWLILRALSKQTRPRFVFAGIALAAAVLMRFGSLSSVGVLLLLPLAAKRPLRAFASCAAGLAVGLAPYLCWSRFRFGGFLYTFVDGWNNFDGPTESPFFFVQRAALVFSWFVIIGFLIWACVSISDVWTGRTAPPRVQGSSSIPLSSGSRQIYLALWALSLFLFFSSLPHKEPRYIIPVAAPLFLLSGVGWSLLFQTPRILARAAAAFLLLVSMALCVWTDHERFSTAFVYHDENEEMIVSSYIREHSDPTTVLYAASSYPDFAYYSGRKTVALPSSGPQVYAVINEIPQNSIVIAYKRYDDGTTPEPKLAWLDGNTDFSKVADFDGIALYRRVRQTRLTSTGPAQALQAPLE